MEQENQEGTWLTQVHLLIRSLKLSAYVSVSLSPFNRYSAGEPGLAGVYWSKGWRRWCRRLDYWSYKSCKAPVKSSLPTNQHRSFRGRMPFLSSNQQCQSKKLTSKVVKSKHLVLIMITVISSFVQYHIQMSMLTTRGSSEQRFCIQYNLFNWTISHATELNDNSASSSCR